VAKLKVAELRAELESRGLNKLGSKKELAQRLTKVRTYCVFVCTYFHVGLYVCVHERATLITFYLPKHADSASTFTSSAYLHTAAITSTHPFNQ